MQYIDVYLSGNENPITIKLKNQEIKYMDNNEILVITDIKDNDYHFNFRYIRMIKEYKSDYDTPIIDLNYKKK